jgi:hypothetical protein
VSAVLSKFETHVQMHHKFTLQFMTSSYITLIFVSLIHLTDGMLGRCHYFYLYTSQAKCELNIKSIIHSME